MKLRAFIYVKRYNKETGNDNVCKRRLHIIIKVHFKT